MKEYFQVVDEKDRVIGKATRERCHSNREIIHRAVSVVVLNKKGEILLEKRSMKKDMEPGKWGLVAGHVSPGESYEEAAIREIEEEIGTKPEKINPLFKVFFRTDRESEIIKCFSFVCEGPFKFNREEMDEVRFFKKGEIKDALKKGSMKITEFDTIILNKFLRIRQ